MREILEAVFGLLIAPEPEDPLDSILAEEYLTSHEKYEQEAKKQTEESAGESLDAKEKKLVMPVPQFIPEYLICPLTKKTFVDPVITKYGAVYEQKAIHKHLRRSKHDPFADPKVLLRRTDLKPARDMKKMVKKFRSGQILETSV